MKSPLPHPRIVLEQMLATNGIVHMHLQPEAHGVELPDDCPRTPAGHVVLQLSHAFPVPMRDFRITAFCVEAGLSFNRQLFHCVVPWDAVRILEMHHGKAGKVLCIAWFPVSEYNRAMPEQQQKKPTLQLVKS